MKRSILSFLVMALLSPVHADDSDYRSTLNVTHERFRVLDIERSDYRKPKPELPPVKEEERLRLLGQLLTDDPVWVLAEQIQTDISALVAIRSQPPSDVAIVEDLKDFLAITSSLEDRATTRMQAEGFATALRRFIARRDVPGAHTRARLQ